MFRPQLQKEFFPSLVLLGFLLVVNAEGYEYKAEDQISSKSLTHRAVPSPFLLKENNHLMVSLEKYLGRTDSSDSEPTPIELISAGRPLVLTDDQGLVHKSS